MGKGEWGKMVEFERCRWHFRIKNVVFKCDLQMGHSGQCISLPDGPGKLATVMWPNEAGF